MSKGETDLLRAPLGQLFLQRFDGGPRVVELLRDERDGRVAVVDVAAEGAELLLHVCLLFLQKKEGNGYIDLRRQGRQKMGILSNFVHKIFQGCKL